MNLGDVFVHGKIRYLLISLTPVLFFFFKKHVHWSLAFYASLIFGNWVFRHYLLLEQFSLILTFSVLAFAYYVAKFPKEKVGKYLVYVGLFGAVIGIMQHFEIHAFFIPKEKWAKHLATGLMGHNTVLGPFLVACLAPALWQKRYITAAILFLACLFTKSSMTYAALGAVCFMFGWKMYGFKPVFKVATALTLLAICGYFSEYFPELFSLSGRQAIWPHAIGLFLDNPVWGGGSGAWLNYSQTKLGLVGGLWWPQIHSDWLEVLVAYGLVGTLPLLFAIGQFIYKLKPDWPHAVCVALLVNAMANFPFQIASIALIFTVSWMYVNQGESRNGRQKTVAI